MVLQQKFKWLKKELIPIVFFSIYLIIGLYIFDDYGVGWDESLSIRNGIINCFEINKKLNYIILPESKVNELIEKSGFSDKINDVKDFEYNYLGAINEIILLVPVIITKNYNDSHNIIYIRHLMIFLIFWISAIFFYKIIYDRYKSQLFSIIGCSFLILSPRIFADSFYNSKDIVLLSFVIIAIYFSIRFFKKNNIKYAIICALFSAIVVDIRILGIYLPVLVVLFLLIILLKKHNELKLNSFYPLISFLILLFLYIYIFWAYLWDGNPISKFLEAINVVSRIGYHPDILYMGKVINSAYLPWHYSFIWIFLTTPVIYTLLFFVGLYFIIKKGIKIDNWFINNDLLVDIFLLLCVIVPLISIISLHSVLYNGWRHLYFVHVGLILTSIHGAYNLNNLLNGKKIFKGLIQGSIILYLTYILTVMIKLHPHQMLYFNVISHKTAFENFDYDYWGLTYRKGYEKLLSYNNESSSKIRLWTNEFLIPNSTYRQLTKNQQERIEFIKEISQSDYCVIEYSFLFNNIENFYKRYNIKPEQEIDSLCVADTKVLSIYKLKNDNYIDSNINAFSLERAITPIK
jgi:hypothetical protein